MLAVVSDSTTPTRPILITKVPKRKMDLLKRLLPPPNKTTKIPQTEEVANAVPVVVLAVEKEDVVTAPCVAAEVIEVTEATEAEAEEDDATMMTSICSPASAPEIS